MLKCGCNVVYIGLILYLFVCRMLKCGCNAVFIGCNAVYIGLF